MSGEGSAVTAESSVSVPRAIIESPTEASQEFPSLRRFAGLGSRRVEFPVGLTVEEG